MKITLVEDEALALDELRYLMNPYESAHTVVCFKSGEEAVADARLSAPDIVISDIRMPGLNGLGVVEEMIALQPRTQAVMLSGYNDFEYVRTALKLGAKEYLLKPVLEAELYAAVDRMIVAARKEEEKSRLELHWSLSRSVRGILEGADDIRNELEGDWVLITMLLENWNSSYLWHQTGISASSISSWLRGEGYADTECFDMDEHLRIVMWPLGSSEKEGVIRQRVSLLHQYICSQGLVVHSVYRHTAVQHSLADTYKQCLLQLESQVRLGESTFMQIEQPVHVQSFWDSARRIEQHVREQDYAKLQLELRRMIEGLRRERKTLKQTSVLLADFLYALKFKLSDSQFNADHGGADSLYEFLKSCREETMLVEWLSSKLAALMAGIEKPTLEPKQIIPSMIEYARQHYGEAVHLQDFAARHHVSVGYLSKLFKTETGDNFSDYIIRLRMNKARELLDNGYTKVAEIGKFVGYEDPKFFSQTFKRWTGVTPQEYRRKEK
ncbi:response regulator [Paenibacillus sp. HN-1]|uniref:response regulator transcription factor n=1 Tax=Paenibacillus TaxID=44249 RepID=UPI001CA98AF7|nr:MULTISPECIES: helix-turn-helix domain-containing protein [Paenibacillus]MBY9080727.1 response regulator [Paenibacillus sp. CGMCC 1.18879]MBY9085281.1 response regulator [Paenibacillus sinensis]